TWHTIEFSNNRHIRIFAETIHLVNSFASFFFAAMYLAYFIHFHFANPEVFPNFTSSKRIRPAKFEAISISRIVCKKNCFSLLGVCHHSAAATQKTLHAPLRPCKSAGEERAGDVTGPGVHAC
ncbi:hypothetical protein ABLI39_12930, partial [Pseudarthrobacter sp. B907]|uniref:hypothetical protein n=1 Tax=Pseudarthrobacter sp. B907 TaxID=3158261 RepID=UPI0032DB678C